MGAGVVRAQQDNDGNINVYTAGGPHIVINTPPHTRTSSSEMVCESCSTSFTLLRRKKRCKECDRYFCSDCIVYRPESSLSNKLRKSCRKCQILISGNFTKQDLQDWKVKDLRSLLKKRNISMEACTEKHDLIELLYMKFAQNSGNNAPNSSNIQMGQNRERTSVSQNSNTSSDSSYSGNPSTSQTNTAFVTTIPQATPIPGQTFPQQPSTQPETEEQRAERLRQRQIQELAEAEARYRQQQMQDNQQENTTQGRVKRFAVTDIQSEEEIEGLTVKQLKEVLVNNFVDYKGCVEKAELQQRVKRLWKEHRNNQQKAQEIHSSSDNPETVPPGAIPPSHKEEDLCKICLDHVIDCVLLECGHMVTCTQCGRRLAECPICRQHIVRVVHTFKS